MFKQKVPIYTEARNSSAAKMDFLREIIAKIEQMASVEKEGNF